eukprot:CAMPEP_0184696552 /NCGR_PEP_ID=MMETSP0313-20130426/3795_1 /TAXON_ID=2792 /ORGANISM="Porphyridium aerugineum, Strain SAG 1380-2" /LENGTH=369 /DNA_ID=CAMNT_0027155185 /DNA_START=75 /DNA_END=1184 /DNA_ORIENTATION=+
MQFASSTNIFLSGEGYDVKSVRVSPMALFSILDHYMRRPEKNGRVIGALLGTIHEDFTIDIKSSFPVSHSETTENAALDVDYFGTMLDLHSKVSSSDVIVGWYGTGTTTDANSVVFHEFFARSCPSPVPVHLLMDASLEAEDLKPRAFVTTAFFVDDVPLKSEFRQVPVELSISASEKVGLSVLNDSNRKQQQNHDDDDDDDDLDDDKGNDDIVDDNEEDQNKAEDVIDMLKAEAMTRRFRTAGGSSAMTYLTSPAEWTKEAQKLRKLKEKYALPAEVDNLELSLARLHDLLEIVSDVVSKVAKGEAKGDETVGRYLAETLAMVPRMDEAEFEKMIGDSLRDHLMVLFCTKLTQIQLAMTEKLLAVDLQ